MKAIGTYILIKEVNEDITISGGLLLTEKDKSMFRYSCGVVESVGGDVKEIQKGDKVYYDKGQSFGMIIDGKTIMVIRERDIVLVN